MAYTGWRKPTPGLAKAEQLAQVGERLAVPKAQAIVAVKKIAAAIKLRATDMLLLDTLAAVTQSQDWEEGSRPIVWPSNAFLVEQTGFSLAALRRHIRRLCEAGIISMKDSPNGKRWGRRDDNGYIIEAYGFDLAPLAARTEEFEALHAALLEERALCKTLRNTITASRRIIRAKIEEALESGLRGPWKALAEEFSMALHKLPKGSVISDKLLDLVDWFSDLKKRVEEAFTNAFDWQENSDMNCSGQAVDMNNKAFSNFQNMKPMGLKNETHIQTTNELNFVNSRNSSKKTKADSISNSNNIEEVKALKDEIENTQWSIYEKKINSKIEISTVVAACPEFTDTARSFVRGYVKNWNDLHRAAGILKSMIGISEDAWILAQKILGPWVAASAIALIYDKSVKGEVTSAGGYLRGIIEKSNTGKLYLERSFYGRLNQKTNE